MFTCVLGRLVNCFHSLYQYRNLSEGASRVGGQLRGDKECPFSGVTKSGRVWRKVLESDARSVMLALITDYWTQKDNTHDSVFAIF